MKKQKVVPVWVSILMAALCIVAFSVSIQSFEAGRLSTIEAIAAVAELLSALLAVCYCITGYEKTSALFFKAVVISRLVFSAMMIILMTAGAFEYTKALTGVTVGCDLIVFGCMAVFAVALNIGKERSVTMAVIMVIATVVPAILIPISGKTGGIGIGINKVLSAVIFLIMVIAKYRDKEARGTN